ncbi:13203_t:CDS:2, partial [Cetraspora pellucida]
LKKQVHLTGQGESTIFVLDGKTNECVYCETVELYPRKRRMVMDMEVFNKHADVQIRNDLIDCQIDICTSFIYREFLIIKIFVFMAF